MQVCACGRVGVYAHQFYTLNMYISVNSRLSCTCVVCFVAVLCVYMLITVLNGDVGTVAKGC